MQDLHRRDSTQRSRLNSFAIEFEAQVIEIAQQRRIENLASQREALLREYDVTQRMRDPHRRDSTRRSTFHSFAIECEARRIESLAIQRERDFLSHTIEIEAQLREYTQRIRDNSIQRKMIYESLSERSRQILDQTAVAVDVSFFLGEEGDLCCICREQFKDGGAAIAQWPAECAHIFHLDCLLPWLSEHRSCPLCRAAF